MQISEIGAQALLDKLNEGLSANSDVTIPNGDDAAVCSFSGETVVASHLLLEGVHFNLDYMPVEHLGYKAIASTISNIVAMNAVPRGFTISLGVTSHWEVEDLETLYKGVRRASEAYGLSLLGGDLSPSVGAFTIAVTAIGEAVADAVVSRKGAQETDLLCCSGNLGAAFLGLKALEREAVANANEQESSDRLAGVRYLLQRQLTPIPRLDILERMRTLGLRPTAMMDISKGIATDLLSLAEASGVSFRLYEDKLPIDLESIAFAKELNINVDAAALHGGEDYELLFTVPLGMKDVVEQMDEVSVIGYCTDPSEPNVLVTRTGSEVALKNA